MEDIVIIAMVMMVGIFSLVGMKMFKPDTNRKQAKVNASDSAQKEVITSKDLTITTLKDELRSVMGKLTRMRDKEPELEEEVTESGSKQVTWDEIQALVKTQAPKYASMLHLVKKQVMEATEGMSMEEILNYVKQFTGNKQSQDGVIPAPDASGYRPDWA